MHREYFYTIIGFAVHTCRFIRCILWLERHRWVPELLPNFHVMFMPDSCEEILPCFKLHETTKKHSVKVLTWNITPENSMHWGLSHVSLGAAVFIFTTRKVPLGGDQALPSTHWGSYVDTYVYICVCFSEFSMKYEIIYANMYCRWWSIDLINECWVLF